MVASSTSRLVGLCGLIVLVAIAVATLIPTQWEVRTGLHWLTEHFIVYFVVTAIICVAWPRPVLVATLLMAAAGLLEAMQGLTLTRTPDLPTALSGAGGVLTAALLVWLVTRVRRVHSITAFGSLGAKRS